MRPKTHIAKSPTFITVLAAALIITVFAWAHFTSAAGVLAIDKVITKNQTTASTTVTTASFSTVEANELLVAFVAADGPTTAGGQNVTGITTTGATLTWTLRQRVNTQYGTSEIWQAVAPSVVSNITVKATLKSSAVSFLGVAAFTGADTTTNGAVGGANAASGAPSVGLTATRNGSWTFGIGNDWDSNTARTVGANQTKVAEYLASVGDTFWLQRQTTAAGVAGSTATLNDTAPTNDRWNFASIEILPATIDTTAPTVPANVTATATASTSVNLSWTASTDAVGVTGYRIYRGGTLLTSVSSGTTYTDNTTTASTSYSYTVRAFDAAGNESADSAPATVTTPAPDTTPPVISTATATSITQTSTTITWTTDEASDTQVEYGTTTSYGSSSALNASLVTSHSANLSGLSPATTYHYRVKSKDGSGNLATSADFVFTTQAPAADTTPPTTSVTSPSNGGTVSGTVSVTANATDNVGVVGVQFKLDGNNLGSEDTTSPYSISWNTTAVANGSHRLQSIARDAAGNTTSSSIVTVTVNNGGSGTPLTINGSTTYQTMDGFGTSINPASWSGDELKPALDMLIDQNGSRIFRVIVEQADWEATNDNSDPNTYNWTYYNGVYANARFQKVWNTIAYLNQKGIPAQNIIISIMGQGPSWLSSDGGRTVGAAQLDEWAEMVSSFAIYGHNTAGVQFSMFAPNNETDLGAVVEGIVMNSTVYTNGLAKVSQRLDAQGLSDIRLVGPDTSDISAGVNDFMPKMMTNPTVMGKVDHFAFHNYSASTGNAANAIANSSYPNKNFWMSEFSIFNDSFSLLSGGASALITWDGYDSVYQHAIQNGLGSQPGNDAGNAPAMIAYNSTTHAYTPRKSLYQFAQLFKYVPAGSVRIGATQSNGNVSVVAFYHPTSKNLTIVGYNRGSTNVNYSGTLAGVQLPSSFAYYTTDNSVNMQRGSDVAVTSGAFSVTAPANGVFTLTYAPPSDQVAPTAPSNLQATGSIGQATLSWTAATDNIAVTGYNVHRSSTPNFTPSAANKIGQTNALTYTDTTSAGTYYYQVVAVDAASNTSAASNEASATVTADTQAPTVPTGLQTGAVSGSSASFSWTASIDNVGVAGYKVYRGGTFLANSASTSYTDTTVQQNTSYSYTVSAIDTAGNESAVSSPLAVTTPAQTLTVDAQVSANKDNTSGNSVTATRLTTTTSNELLVAFVASSGASGGGNQSFSSVTTSGLTWTLQKRVNGRSGTTEIWTAYAANILNNANITATQTNGGYVASITVTAFKGASATIGATGGASAASGGASASLTSTRVGSLVWGAGNDWDAATTIVVGSNQTKVYEFQSSYGDTLWVQRSNVPSTSVGQTITLNDIAPTADQWNFAIIEILPL